MRPRAFLLEPCDLDVTGASKFGEIVTLYSHKNARPHELTGALFQSCVLDTLEHYHFDPDRDFIIITGKTVALALMIGAVCVTYEDVKALCFDPSPDVKSYVQVNIGVPEHVVRS